MYTLYVNLFAVILAAIASMGLGMLWYSSVLFGKKWMVLVGMTPEMMSSAKSSAKRAYMVSTVASLVMAYILGVFMNNLLVPNLGQALFVGFMAWLGFVATTMINEYLFSVQKKSWTLYLINVGYQLVSLLIGSAIIYALS